MGIRKALIVTWETFRKAYSPKKGLSWQVAHTACLPGGSERHSSRGESPISPLALRTVIISRSVCAWTGNALLQIAGFDVPDDVEGGALIRFRVDVAYELVFALSGVQRCPLD